jgi:arylformamidase
MLVYSTFDQETLDREYSPSSCIDDINVYLERYARSSRRVKDVALANGSCVADLSYGPSPDEKLDLFLPASPTNAPLQIFLHGGYWQALSKEDSLFAAATFQRYGSHFAAIDYTLAPKAGLTQIVGQCRRAIRWLYENANEWGFDREQLYVSGSSAGAHLAAMMLQTDWTDYAMPRDALSGACAVSGIYDLEPIRLSYVNEPLRMTAAEAQQNSPLGKKPRNRCPIILAFGDIETREFKRQTDAYRDFLLSAGAHVEFREIEHRNHFDVILDLADADTWLSRAVRQQMQLT